MNEQEYFTVSFFDKKDKKALGYAAAPANAPAPRKENRVFFIN